MSDDNASPLETPRQTKAGLFKQLRDMGIDMPVNATIGALRERVREATHRRQAGAGDGPDFDPTPPAAGTDNMPPPPTPLADNSPLPFVPLAVAMNQPDAPPISDVVEPAPDAAAAEPPIEEILPGESNQNIINQLLPLAAATDVMAEMAAEARRTNAEERAAITAAYQWERDMLIQRRELLELRAQVKVLENMDRQRVATQAAYAVRAAARSVSPAAIAATAAVDRLNLADNPRPAPNQTGSTAYECTQCHGN